MLNCDMMCVLCMYVCVCLHECVVCVLCVYVCVCACVRACVCVIMTHRRR